MCMPLVQPATATIGYSLTRLAAFAQPSTVQAPRSARPISGIVMDDLNLEAGHAHIPAIEPHEVQV